MGLADRDWIVYCRQCGEWTGLHQFLSERGHFQGERSITMNAYLNSDLLLGKFLIHHADHDLMSVPDLSDDFHRITLYKERFLERLIDRIVEDRLQRDQDRAAEEYRRNEGESTLLALRGLFSERLNDLARNQPYDEETAKVHRGTSLGVEWCRAQVSQLLEFRRRA